MDPARDTQPKDSQTPPVSGAPAVPLKKYIRTFASDMEVLQKGGTPELAPLLPKTEAAAPAAPVVSAAPPPPGPPPPAPAFRPAAPEPHTRPHPANLNILAAPPPQAPQPTPAFRPVPAPKPIPSMSASGVAKHDTLLTPDAGPPPPPVFHPEPPPPPPPPKPPPAIRPSPLQTYSSDFSDRLQKTQASATTVLAAEQDAKRGPVSAEPMPEKGGALYVAAGIMLLVLGATGAYFAYTRYLARLAPVILVPAASAPIFVDEREEVSGAGAALARALTESVNRPLPEGAVRFLHLSSTSTPNIFIALELPAPGILLRNIRADEGMAGVVRVRGAQSPFFILSVASYSDTFAGMLSWEATMARDLAALYPGTASTTATTTQLGFTDEVIANHDARVYRGVSGESLFYGYWDQRTLLVARDEGSFTEILSRLANSRTER